MKAKDGNSIANSNLVSVSSSALLGWVQQRAAGRPSRGLCVGGRSLSVSRVQCKASLSGTCGLGSYAFTNQGRGQLCFIKLSATADQTKSESQGRLDHYAKIDLLSHILA
jgi:hypothetical protein